MREDILRQHQEAIIQNWNRVRELLGEKRRLERGFICLGASQQQDDGDGGGGVAGISGSGSSKGWQQCAFVLPMVGKHWLRFCGVCHTSGL